MRAAALLASYASPVRVCDSADFDATNDFMARGAGLSGAADSKLGILSVWLRFDGSDGVGQKIIGLIRTLGGVNDDLRFIKATTNVLQIVAANAALSNILDVRTVSTFTAGATWFHVLLSWDMAVTTNVYVNDVSDKNQVTRTDDIIDYTKADCVVGAQGDGTIKFDGCMAELYFAPGQYLDFSLVANRRKFIAANGKPVHLGTTGSLPTGTAPLVYAHLDDAESAANFATNRGTGGNFTITGALTTGSTSPSD